MNEAVKDAVTSKHAPVEYHPGRFEGVLGLAWQRTRSEPHLNQSIAIWRQNNQHPSEIISQQSRLHCQPRTQGVLEVPLARLEPTP